MPAAEPLYTADAGAVGQLQSAARLLSGMLAEAVAQTAAEPAAQPPSARELKELTAILKDITGVVKTLEPPAEEDARTGIVVLPQVEVCPPD